jgi:osmotically-inducible protein OsmY
MLTLSGAVSTHNDVLDIERFAMKQPGVQEIVKRITFDSKLASLNVKKAKLLEAKIHALFEGVKYFSISLYSEYAELSGTVNTYVDRDLVEEYVLQVLPLKKVINKLFVTKRY